MSVQREYAFFTDRDLGKQFPDMLKNAGIHVERHSNHFSDDAKDEDWLKEVSKQGWYVLTHDRTMRYRASEIDAIKSFKIGVFVIVGKAPFAELAQNFVHTFHRITRFIDKHPPPFVAKIYRPDQKKIKEKLQPPGYVKMWVTF